MIRYRRLDESENSGIKLYDVVKCAGYEWYVIKKGGNFVTLLAKSKEFGYSEFDDKSTDYATSKIRKYLSSNVLPRLSVANPITNKLFDVGVTDKVWLLSLEEAQELPGFVREFDHWWWTRSGGGYDREGAVIYAAAGVGFGAYNSRDNNSVRPAMQVHIKDLD